MLGSVLVMILPLLVLLMFFFSSRRRHTRSLCDWSSDVCSSDLEHPGQMRLECRSRTAISCDSRERREQHFRRPAEKADRFWSAPRKRTRSEERRVGKESRYYLGAYLPKNNAWKRAGDDTSSACIVDVFFFKQKTAYEITV